MQMIFPLMPSLVRKRISVFNSHNASEYMRIQLNFYHDAPYEVCFSLAAALECLYRHKDRNHRTAIAWEDTTVYHNRKMIFTMNIHESSINLAAQRQTRNIPMCLPHLVTLRVAKKNMWAQLHLTTIMWVSLQRLFPKRFSQPAPCSMEKQHGHVVYILHLYLLKRYCAFRQFEHSQPCGVLWICSPAREHKHTGWGNFWKQRWKAFAFHKASVQLLQNEGSKWWPALTFHGLMPQFKKTRSLCHHSLPL